MFFGNVFPTLYTVQQKLEALQHRPVKHAKNFALAILSHMTTRFQNHLSFTDRNSNRIVAAIAHPYFKLRWIPDDRKEFCRNLFVNAARIQHKQMVATSTMSTCPSGPTIQTPAVQNDDFFLFSNSATELNRQWTG